MCLSSSMASPHHRVGDTDSLYVREAGSAQRLQEVSFPSWHCSWETPGLLGSLLHRCSWHHSCLGYLFMSSVRPGLSRAGFVVMRRIEDEGMEREFLLPRPILALPAAVSPVPALSSLVKMLTMTFCMCPKKKKSDNPNVYIFYCLTQQTYRAPFFAKP